MKKGKVDALLGIVFGDEGKGILLPCAGTKTDDRRKVRGFCEDPQGNCAKLTAYSIR